MDVNEILLDPTHPFTVKALELCKDQWEMLWNEARTIDQAAHIAFQVKMENEVFKLNRDKHRGWWT